MKKGEGREESSGMNICMVQDGRENEVSALTGEEKGGGEKKGRRDACHEQAG